MPIYDQGYRRWNGEIQASPLRWWPIARQGVMQFLPQRKYLMLMGFAWVGMLFRGAQLFTYLRGREVTDLIRQQLGGVLDLSAGPSFYWSAVEQQMIWVVIFTIMVGADLIAADRRHKALQLYFSKPITANDYIFGKLGVIAAFQIIVLWIPSMLLWTFGMMLEPTGPYFREVWMVPLAITMWSAVVMGITSMMMLAMSAVGQRSVFISVSWIIFFGWGPFQLVILLLREFTGSQYWGLVSMHECLKQVGSWFFGLEAPWEFHPALALLVLLAVIGGAYSLVRARIKPVEVVL